MEAAVVSARRQPSRPLPASWQVTIERHTCARWIVPASVTTLPAPDGDSARLYALRGAHGRLAMPPWKPLLRLSWPHSSAAPIGEPTDAQREMAIEELAA